MDLVIAIGTVIFVISGVVLGLFGDRWFKEK